MGNSQFGDTSYELYLRQLALTENVQDLVLFLGFRKDIQQLLPELDIVTLPSIHEPFALTMIEAMAFGKPFIGADSGGTPELINNNKNGILIPSGNHEALAQAILTLLANKKKAKKIGAQGRISIIQHCNIEKLASQLSDLYLSLTSEANNK